MSQTERRRGASTPALVLAAVVLLVAATGFAVDQRRAIVGHLAQLPLHSAPDAPGHTIAGAYLYQQQRSLSCEYASTAIAATIAGHNVTEYDVEALVPLDENPHLGYRGNIHGDWGNTADYGVYNEPLHAALATRDIPSSVIYANGDREMLTRELDADRPVVVWLAMRGAINSFDAYSVDGTRYQLTQWMHVMTAYGYDEEGVYLTDPGTAVYRFYAWDDFMTMWNVMDGMGLSVHPA